MTKTNKDHDAINNHVDNASDVIKETDPFASLNKILEENSEFRSTYESLMNLLEPDSTCTSEEEVEVEYVEIDGHDYIVTKRFEISSNTYLYLVNEDNVLDYVIQKIIIEDGEEYVTGLDSEKEFDLVQAYIQRDFLMQLKDKLQNDKEDQPENQ